MENLTSTMKYRVILVADGNPTGIVQFPDNFRRSEYSQIASSFMSRDSRLEQFGFLEGVSSFYMSGGEFSGNSAIAAAWLIFKLKNQKEGTFSMSGLTKPVNYKILDNGLVQCIFSVEIKSKIITLMEGINGALVDMGGIVHFVFEPKTEFINDPDYYKIIHAKIVQTLDLGHRSAVGAIWQEETGQGVKIDPIVWVKDINSFFYETACGSGTLAVLVASGKDNLSIIQPSGKTIQAAKINNNYSLASEVTELDPLT